jgi:hypothetical protein
VWVIADVTCSVGFGLWMELCPITNIPIMMSIA